MAAMPPVSAKPAHLANHSAWRWHPLGTGVAVLHRPIPAALRGAHNGGRGAGSLGTDVPTWRKMKAESLSSLGVAVYKVYMHALKMASRFVHMSMLRSARLGVRW